MITSDIIPMLVGGGIVWGIGDGGFSRLKAKRQQKVLLKEQKEFLKWNNAGADDPVNCPSSWVTYENENKTGETHFEAEGFVLAFLEKNFTGIENAFDRHFLFSSVFFTPKFATFEKTIFGGVICTYTNPLDFQQQQCCRQFHMFSADTGSDRAWNTITCAVGLNVKIRLSGTVDTTDEGLVKTFKNFKSGPRFCPTVEAVTAQIVTGL
ncbi:hypothetical protein [Ferrovum myxofaciens]|uniref:Uncharacterized protein n=1 Tax=Ferrovum myxofaciens TaxID=416213 RepID=A0A9E6MXP3_9PROT|nr:hypothetical protein [Ferrovum myxofaciens]QKE37850.1 MAG: hypothetical protein HO273_03160 [Ferrovum myxofaciens]QWY75530.1 MAG: hypothetical protein JVY19_03605 [Ferrovum myxofaciens]QWY78268.1 MAG: hypothetical protein JZL65_04120 [Ferrovum myxofaciens]